MGGRVGTRLNRVRSLLAPSGNALQVLTYVADPHQFQNVIDSCRTLAIDTQTK